MFTSYLEVLLEWAFFSTYLFIYERGRDRKCAHLLVHFPNAPGWAKTKARSRDLNPVSVVGGRDLITWHASAASQGPHSQEAGVRIGAGSHCYGNSPPSPSFCSLSKYFYDEYMLHQKSVGSVYVGPFLGFLFCFVGLESVPCHSPAVWMGAASSLGRGSPSPLFCQSGFGCCRFFPF